MPNFLLSDADALDISAFLIAQSTPLANPPGVPKVQRPEAIEAGAKIYGEAFCASCHALRNTIQSVTGQLARRNMGPDVTRIGSKAKASWLESWMSNPTAYNPATTMPHYRFKAEQIAYFKGVLVESQDRPQLPSQSASLRSYPRDRLPTDELVGRGTGLRLLPRY